MFARIEHEFGQKAVCDHLMRSYFQEIHAEKLLSEVGVPPAPGVETPYLWSGRWRVALGLRPGTGSGNQVSEAFNRPLQEEISAAGGPCTPVEVLPFLQGFFSKWQRSLGWDGDAGRSSQPHAVDLRLLAGSSLRRAGRSTAEPCCLHT